HRLARRVGIERVPRGLAAVAADRRLDPARPRARPAADERLVAALERTLPDELLQPLERLVRAGHHEQAGRVAVEPVDDARTLLVLAAAREPDEPVHERPARVAGRRVDDDAGRLVDDEHVLVLVRDPERHVLVLQRRRRLRHGQLDLLPAFEPVALGAPFAVDDHAALVQQPLGCRAGPNLGQGSEEAVEPLTGGLVRDCELQRVSPSSSVTKRIATPTTMKLSARLKAGQYFRSRKSVTCPSRMRSIRFDVDPPISRPSATGSTGWRAPERAKKSSIQPTASAVRAVTSGVALANRPKAIPEFWTWWIENGPSTWSDSSSESWLETI